MCGRFAQPKDAKKVFADYNLKLTADYQSSYNVFPGSLQPIIAGNPDIQIIFAKWGLIPSWSKEFRSKFSTINARAETVLTSPVYRTPFLRKRCLVLTSAFYEWRTNYDSTKTRFVIKVKNHEYFSLAGIYDTWNDIENKPFNSFSIITTVPSEKISPIHNREALILEKQNEEVWLNPQTPTSIIQSLLKPYPSEYTDAYPAHINTIPKDLDSPELLK